MTEASVPLINCDDATVEEVATAVVKYIEEHGWTQEVYEDDIGEVCLVGALAKVCTGDASNGVNLLHNPAPGVLRLFEALKSEGTIEVFINEAPPCSFGIVGCNCSEAADESAQPYIAATPIFEFNDMKGQTVDGVLNPLRRVAGLPEVADE